MNPLFMEYWNPYLVGAGIGFLSITSFLVSKRPLGCSTAFSELSGALEKFIRGEKASDNPYYRLNPPGFRWESYLLIGILGGAFISSLVSGSLHLEKIPEFWILRFGESFWLRQGAALGGGILLGLGSRMAGGCVSGHGLSGTQQNGISSWFALCFFFIGAVLVSFFLYGVF